ncbi:MAG TPA: alkaline phosphatase family protein [Candidatus Polarisedimenticolia bacterium]|nr:alkaline phosphatase family protein [Candidatus Polarisedimenticolia bacterium]
MACALALLASIPRAGSVEPPVERKSLSELTASGSPTGVKVVLIGIDGATFKVLEPLLASGRLPQLQSLIERGARGILRSLPQPLSPAVWTSIVTGQEPSVHGIRDFLVVRPGALDGKTAELVTSNDRRSFALWNLVGPFGKSVGFVGWWATWPAEPVRGWILSDRMARSRFTEWHHGARSEMLTFPRNLAEELRPLIVDPARPPVAEIRDLVEMSPAEMNEFMAVKKPIFAHGPSVFKFAYCEQRTYEEMALKMLSRGQPDLMGVYLIANDPVSHTFWHLYEPEKFQGVPPQEAKRLGRLIPNLSVHNDRYLAKLIKMLSKDTVVMVLSDHGFEASGRLPQPRPAGEFAENFEEARAEALAKGTVTLGQPGQHTLDGIFVAAGGPIRKGITTSGSVLDIAPTILALMGLPVPGDMKGRVLIDIIDPEFLARHPVRSIPSYKDYLKRESISLTSRPEEEQEKLEMLRSLGYIR